ncbi:hypothetical protein EVAR_87896_1 [Eumeta japonica]|uniref:Uncharacterized protein n=1 Tax=Eumeta variegata TaxID=151549 RepID=A0A4C1WV98_EUMVA|nr:hypothetical protein EVAR_87896_1 [Eumeta japonica]
MDKRTGARYSPPPMETRNPRGSSRNTSTLLGSWETIEYLIVGDRIDRRGNGGVSHRNSNSLDEMNSGICYFSSVFCQSVVLHRYKNFETYFEVAPIQKVGRDGRAGRCAAHGPAPLAVVRRRGALVGLGPALTVVQSPCSLSARPRPAPRAPRL